jgi:hypothetical protein
MGVHRLVEQRGPELIGPGDYVDEPGPSAEVYAAARTERRSAVS